MKFTKEVSVCIVAAALSLMTDSSLDTSTYMASSLKLKLSVTSDAEPSKNYFYSHPEATRKCREELVQNASSFETTYEKIEIQGINQNASSFERCVEFYKRQVYNEVEEEDNYSVTTSSGSEAPSSSMQSQTSTPTPTSSMRSWARKSRPVKASSSAAAGSANHRADSLDLEAKAAAAARLKAKAAAARREAKAARREDKANNEQYDRPSVFWNTYGHLAPSFGRLAIGIIFIIVAASVGGAMIDEHNKHEHY